MSTAAPQGPGQHLPPPAGPPVAAGPPAGRPPGPGPAPAARAPGWFRRGLGLGAGASLGAGLVLSAFALVGTLLAGLVVVGLVGAAAGVGDEEGPTTTTVWGEQDAPGRLVSVEVTGVILGDEADGGAFASGTYGYAVADVIDGLDADEADGLVLELNTPGGTIYGSRAIAEAVERYQERTGHSVLAYVRGMSASGGMYAMAGADEIVADHGTLVGSIGVIMGPFERYRDVTELQGSLLTPGVEAGGITREYLTQGEGKDLGNPFRDMTPEERAVLVSGLENEYAEFVGWVSTQRDLPEQTIREDVGAYVYGPQDAIAKGLVDDVMGRDEAFRRAAELNGLDPARARVDRVQSDDFISLLLGGASDTDPARAGEAAAAGGDVPVGVLCTGSPLVLAFHGDLAAVCGG